MKQNWMRFVSLFMALALVIVSGVVVTNKGFRAEGVDTAYESTIDTEDSEEADDSSPEDPQDEEQGVDDEDSDDEEDQFDKDSQDEDDEDSDLSEEADLETLLGMLDMTEDDLNEEYGFNDLSEEEKAQLISQLMGVAAGEGMIQGLAEVPEVPTYTADQLMPGTRKLVVAIRKDGLTKKTPGDENFHNNNNYHRPIADSGAVYKMMNGDSPLDYFSIPLNDSQLSDFTDTNQEYTFEEINDELEKLLFKQQFITDVYEGLDGATVGNFKFINGQHKIYFYHVFQNAGQWHIDGVIAGTGSFVLNYVPFPEGKSGTGSIGLKKEPFMSQDSDYTSQTKTYIVNAGKADNGNDLVLPGYTFLGWSKTQGADTPEYPIGSSVEVPLSYPGADNTVTLYGVWKANTPLELRAVNGEAKYGDDFAKAGRDVEVWIGKEKVATISGGEGTFSYGDQEYIVKASASVSSSVKNADKYPGTVTVDSGWTITRSSDGKSGQEDFFYNSDSVVPADFTVTKKPITITTDDKDFQWEKDKEKYRHKVYDITNEDGNSIKNNLPYGDKLIISDEDDGWAFVSYDSANQVENSVKWYFEDKDIAANYDVTVKFGELNLLFPKEPEYTLTIRPGYQEKVYNGQDQQFDNLGDAIVIQDATKYESSFWERLLQGQLFTQNNNTYSYEYSAKNYKGDAQETFIVEITMKPITGKDVGKYEEAIDKIVIKDKNRNLVDQTRFKVVIEKNEVTESSNNVLEITPVEVILTAPSKTWEFDGQKHTAEEIGLSDDLISGDAAELFKNDKEKYNYTFTGEVEASGDTDVSTIKASLIDSNDPANYTFKYETGTLKVDAGLNKTLTVKYRWHYVGGESQNFAKAPNSEKVKNYGNVKTGDDEFSAWDLSQDQVRAISQDGTIQNIVIRGDQIEGAITIPDPEKMAAEGYVPTSIVIKKENKEVPEATGDKDSPMFEKQYTFTTLKNFGAIDDNFEIVIDYVWIPRLTVKYIDGETGEELKGTIPAVRWLSPVKEDGVFNGYIKEDIDAAKEITDTDGVKYEIYDCYIMDPADRDDNIVRTGGRDLVEKEITDIKFSERVIEDMDTHHNYIIHVTYYPEGSFTAYSLTVNYVNENGVAIEEPEVQEAFSDYSFDPISIKSIPNYAALRIEMVDGETVNVEEGNTVYPVIDPLFDEDGEKRYAEDVDEFFTATGDKVINIVYRSTSTGGGDGETPQTPVTPGTPEITETPETPETPGEVGPSIIPILPSVVPTVPTAPEPVVPVAVIPPTVPVDAPVVEIGPGPNGEGLTLTEITDVETALANQDLGHLCNLLYFLILLATSIILYNYFRNTRKHQERIFEIRKELGEDDPYRKQDKE